MRPAARRELKQYLKDRRDALAGDRAHAALQQQRRGLPAAASRKQLQQLLNQHQVCLEPKYRISVGVGFVAPSLGGLQHRACLKSL